MLLFYIYLILSSILRKLILHRLEDASHQRKPDTPQQEERGEKLGEHQQLPEQAIDEDRRPREKEHGVGEPLSGVEHLDLYVLARVPHAVQEDRNHGDAGRKGGPRDAEQRDEGDVQDDVDDRPARRREQKALAVLVDVVPSGEVRARGHEDVAYDEERGVAPGLVVARLDEHAHERLHGQHEPHARDDGDGGERLVDPVRVAVAVGAALLVDRRVAPRLVEDACDHGDHLRDLVGHGVDAVRRRTEQGRDEDPVGRVDYPPHERVGDEHDGEREHPPGEAAVERQAAHDLRNAANDEGVDHDHCGGNDVRQEVAGQPHVEDQQEDDVQNRDERGVDDVSRGVRDKLLLAPEVAEEHLRPRQQHGVEVDLDGVGGYLVEHPGYRDDGEAEHQSGGEHNEPDAHDLDAVRPLVEAEAHDALAHVQHYHGSEHGADGRHEVRDPVLARSEGVRVQRYQEERDQLRREATDGENGGIFYQITISTRYKLHRRLQLLHSDNFKIVACHMLCQTLHQYS